VLHFVEIGSFGGDILVALNNMLIWLDARRSRPVISHQVAGDATAFRLGFSSEGEALAFVCAFGGRLTRPEPEAA
jgi:nitrous oxide reductase accessory protein NosL